MEKLYILIMCTGLAVAGYFGYQWWQGSQSVETISIEESETEAPAETSTAEAEEAPIEEPDSTDTTEEETVPVMSDEVTGYEQGEEMARLEIPKIENAYQTFWGADDATLKQGVGMYVSEWTTTPDQKRHTVLSGHRDTVFTELGELETGDMLTLEYEGKRYEYEISETWITDKDDRTVIVDKESPTLTLTTCYPLDYLGNAPDRYIIQADLVSVSE